MSEYTRSSDNNSHHHHRNNNNNQHKHYQRDKRTYQRDKNRSDDKPRHSKGPGQGENHSRRLMVHQTDPQAAANILSTQIMRPGSGGAVGAGCYFCKSMDGCDSLALHNGTYLMADVYLGRTAPNANFGNSSGGGFHSIIAHGTQTCPMYVVNDSNRVKNIRYFAGTRPPNITVQMRYRMPLIYATTKEEAEKIKNTQIIPKENRTDIAGEGIYLWENIPDAQRFAQHGAETFLVADVYFPNCFENFNQMPSHNDRDKYSTFRGNYQGTHYYMVKNIDQIERIHFIGGIRPDSKQASI